VKDKAKLKQLVSDLTKRKQLMSVYL